MARWIVCGGLFLEAVAGLFAIPGVSEAGAAGSGILGSVIAILPGAYRLLAGSFAMIFSEPVEMVQFHQVPVA